MRALNCAPKVEITATGAGGRHESFRWVENLRQATEVIGAPSRCVHVGDRESDIYELFCAAQDSETSFVVRTCVDRLAKDGDTTIATEMKSAKRGTHVAS